MSDLCLVATMLAKMNMATNSASPETELSTIASNLAIHPKAVSSATPAIAPQLQIESPEAEFSATCNSQSSSKVAPQSRTPSPVAPTTPTPLPAVSPKPNLLPFPPSPDSSPVIESFAHRNGPTSGPQLYQQRLAALKAGHLYTHLPSDSFRSTWQTAQRQPTYEEWKTLLAQESFAVSKGQGSNRLNIVVGDSLSLWLPSESLPAGQLWLNQGISGDTTEGILRRISAFKNTRPTHIYVMGGINDLRKGATDNEVLWNLRLVMRQLKQNHPRAQILIQSLLPTAGTIGISNERIRSINQKLASIAHQEGVDYVDLYSHFADTQGDMRPELTTDGLHLTPAGYRVWQSLMQEVEYWLALHQTGAYVS